MKPLRGGRACCGQGTHTQDETALPVRGPGCGQDTGRAEMALRGVIKKRRVLGKVPPRLGGPCMTHGVCRGVREVITLLVHIL